MDSELLPCPFCGEKALMFFSDETRFEDDMNGWVIGCVTENCPGHIAMSWAFWEFDGKEKSIAAWNRRAEPTCTRADMLRRYILSNGNGAYEDGHACSNCGDFVRKSDCHCPTCGRKVVEHE